MAPSIEPSSYHVLLKEMKACISQAQLNAALAVNFERNKLYWMLGKRIVEKLQDAGRGASIVEKLARDLQKSFPGMGGFSRANVFRMRAFFEMCRDLDISPGQFENTPFFHLPWRCNVLILEKVKPRIERLWYAQQCLMCGLSGKALDDWIRTDTFARKGQAITNFSVNLPTPQSRLAQDVLKDPYNFEFLTLGDGYQERELEQGLVTHIQNFLTELGAGFAFVGRQYPLEVDGVDHYLDLLFYHLKLKCYCVVDLKTTEFKPEHAGKMNFYLSALDDLIRDKKTDNPSIGMILCKHGKKMSVEYALRDLNKPIGVSEYEVKILESLPENLEGTLPSIEDFEEELDP